MKTIIQILLWIGCAVFAYLIYQSVTGPIQFAKVKKERFSKVISGLKDIRNYNKDFQIDMPVDTVVIKVLDSVAVRDSLFRDDSRYKSMMNVPGAEGVKFDMKADIISKGDYRAPVFEAKVAKNAILGDQPKDLLARENSQISVEEVNGSFISVGSLIQVSTSGNWPPIYDRKGDQ